MLYNGLVQMCSRALWSLAKLPQVSIISFINYLTPVVDYSQLVETITKSSVVIGDPSDCLELTATTSFDRRQQIAH